MKPRFLFVFLAILLLTSCNPAVNSTPEAATPTTALPQTNTPLPTETESPAGPSLQEGNESPTVRFVPKQFSTLGNNRIGDTFPLDRNQPPCPQARYDWPFLHINSMGLKWVRLSFDYIELETVREADNFSQFEINQCQDEAITNFSDNGVTILYTIVYWDETLHATNYPDYTNEEEVQLFLDYTRFIVSQYQGRIQYYEILNEGYFYVDVADYIELIRQVVPVIREEDPEAKIVVGGTTNLMNIDQQGYIYHLITSDIMPLVDGIALHPMYGPSPQYEDTYEYYYHYPTLIQEIKDLASDNGFTGEFFAEEMCWRTSINPFIWEPWEYTDITAGKYYARGIIMNLGMDLWAGIGGESYDSIPPVYTVVRNLTTVMSDFTPDDLVVEIESQADNIVYYSFSAPNGDRLIALWTDGAAVDDDPGILAALRFENLSAESVIGIDILNSLEQELTTEMADGSLIIQDLLIKDYPIIIKLINTAP